MSEVRVAVLDPCPVAREGLRLVLAGFGLDVIAVGGAECLVGHPPDVLVLGPSIPGRNLLPRIRALKDELPDSRTLVFRVVEGVDFALPCMEAGAAGYLSQPSSCEELADAVRTVAREGRFLSRATAELFTTRVLLGERQLSSPHSRLSARELEVFLLLGAGHTVGEIATLLDISPKTVSTHRARIREKTSLSSNAEIVRYAHERSLV
jgi:DNA-binding NarL/FixJ family response regulator